MWWTLSENTISAIHCTARSGTSTSQGSGQRVAARRRLSAFNVLESRSAVPRDRPLQALGQRRLRLEAEQPLRLRGIERAARLAVGHGRVPADLAREARQLGDRRGQLADRGLDAGAEVDRLGAVVELGRTDEAVRAVLDVEELARRRAVAPEHDLVL